MHRLNDIEEVQDLTLSEQTITKVHNACTIAGSAVSREEVQSCLAEFHGGTTGIMHRGVTEYANRSWSCLVSSSKVSAANTNCFEESFRQLKRELVKRGDDRLPACGTPALDKYSKHVGGLQFISGQLGTPLLAQMPQRVLVNPFGDMFHPDVDPTLIFAMFIVMGAAPQHHFQVLTKHAHRLADLVARLPWFENIWMGVTVENNEMLDRLDHLRKVPARVRWLSIEPLLEDLGELDLSGIHWLVVGGESGSMNQRTQPMHPDWVRRLQGQCAEQGVSFFYRHPGAYIHESQLKANGIRISMSNSMQFDWPDGTRSYRFPNRVEAPRFDGKICRDYPMELPAHPRLAKA